MKFSIIIPAHNSAAFIEKTLKSVREQSFTDYELIVVCDACEDLTEYVARNYADTVVVTDFGRDGLARNAGLDLARGEWVLFMDDDDWWLHDCVLDMLANRIDDTSWSDIIVFGFIWRGRGYTAPRRAGDGIWPNVWSKCWRRSFIGDTRFTDVKMESDLYFTREMFAKVTDNEQIDLWWQPLYYYNYLRPGSQTELKAREDFRAKTCQNTDR